MKSLSTRAKLLIFCYVALNIFVLVASKVNPPFGAELLEEDRTVENITAIGLFLAAFCALYHAVRNLSSGNTFKGLMQILLVLLLIFMGGEEISWGQRIFGWQTTGMFKAENVQGETNFHNLKIDGVKLNKVIFTYGFFAIGFFVFILSPWLYKKYTGFGKFIDRFGATLPSYKHTILLIIGLLFVIMISDKRKWELWECNAAIVIFWVMLEPLNAAAIYSSRKKTDIQK